jgi:very-short-patch-repair endonuclease
MSQPEIKEIMKASIPKSAATRTGIKRPDARFRMLTNNPMNKQECIDKMRAKMVGRTFLSRGGNGQKTKQQIALASRLGWEMETAIPTALVKDQFPSLPPAYKVDVANEELKIAVEVDGRTHTSRKWKFLDKRKTSVLNALGWDVLRFTNKQVDTQLEEVVSYILSFMTSKLKTTTTTSQTES